MNNNMEQNLNETDGLLDEAEKLLGNAVNELEKRANGKLVYIATKYENLDQFEECACRLRAAGHELSHDWTQEDDEGMTGAVRTLYHQNCAFLDLQGVKEADAIILIPTEAKMAGAFVEFGIALAEGKRILIVDGFNEKFQRNIFYFLPTCYVEHYGSIKEAVDAL